MLVEDETVVREGLKCLLSGEGKYHIAAEAASMTEAFAKIKEQPIDVVLLDVQLPDGSGLEAVKELIELSKDIKVIMLSSRHDYEIVHDALLNGCTGFLPTYASFKEMEEALQTVCNGGHYLHPQAATELAKGLQDKKKHSQDIFLNEEELKVLRLVADGLSYAEIAGKIFISERTVRRRIQSVFDKLGVSSKAHAVAEAMRRDFLD